MNSDFERELAKIRRDFRMVRWMDRVTVALVSSALTYEFLVGEGVGYMLLGSVLAPLWIGALLRWPGIKPTKKDLTMFRRKYKGIMASFGIEV